MNEPYTACALPDVVAGDPIERLASLFDDHYDRLYRLARRLAPSADDALDLVQETFLKAARFPKSIPVGATNEEAWLVRVLINIRRDQWRKTSVRDRHDKAAFGDSPSARGGGDPEAALIARTAVWQALNVLAPRRRAIVVMFELEGLAIPAIASLLGISAITVRWHLSMGRRDLTRALKAYMGDSNEKH
jgi:RNA polymerase sigma-70 factor (ECF subfamily)